MRWNLLEQSNIVLKGSEESRIALERLYVANLFDISTLEAHAIVFKKLKTFQESYAYNGLS